MQHTSNYGNMERETAAAVIVSISASKLKLQPVSFEFFSKFQVQF